MAERASERQMAGRHRQLCRTAMRPAGDPERAVDLTQEAFCRAPGDRGQFYARGGPGRHAGAARRSGKARLIIVLVVLVLVAGGAAWLLLRGGPDAAAEAPPPTVRVERGDIVLTVEATGSVASNLDVDIKSKASGRIVSLPYDVSDRVPRHEPGENDEAALVVALDPVDEQRQVQRARSQRDAAEARLRQAEENLRIASAELEAATARAKATLASAQAGTELARIKVVRIRDLFSRNTAAKDELDTAEADYRVAGAQVQVAQAGIEQLKATALMIELRRAEVELAKASLAGAEVDLADALQQLADTRIYSPIDGVVTHRNVQIGQIVASGIVNVGGGTSMMTVSDLSRVFVVASVDESDIGRLVETGRLGQEVDITVDAYPGRHFAGAVERITPLGVSDAKVVTFTVKIEVTGEGRELLLPRMSANVSILASRKNGVLLAPNSAIHYDREQAWVSVLREGRFVRQDVALGLNDGLRAEIVGGADEGDQLEATGGLRTLWSNVGRTTTQPGP